MPASGTAAAPATRSKSKTRAPLCAPRCYPCQTCLPQAQCTVSVGPCLVNCRLQIGQGLVITYVIFLPLTEAKSPVRYHARRVPENLRLCRPVAQDRSVPAHIAETTSVYDSARPNSTTLSWTCRMKTPPAGGQFVAVGGG